MRHMALAVSDRIGLSGLHFVVVMVLAACVSCAPRSTAESEVATWERQAQNVTIIRDDWGIPHIYGKTDADAVFGLIYAQAEDDFNRIETNYLNSMGRLAEAEGEREVYRDLRMKLFIDPDTMKAHYEKSPGWLKVLMNAWANGLNYYLNRHPNVTPRVIKRFEPWMALTFSEGSIGGDIEQVNLTALEAFYDDSPADSSVAESPNLVEPSGSNGIAIAPSNTGAHRTLLLINPHTSFYFRAEAQAVSDEGLNAYGAVTWGQFFIYQGFNDRAGWMHTSSGVDNIDEYLETVVKRNDRVFYRYGAEERPLETSTITIPYKTATGVARKQFTVYRTHHGPIVRKVDDKWVSVRLMQDPIKALTQSYMRTKARHYKAFRDTMELHTNSSNNTVYADADGTIAYFHSNFIPRRDTRFDWTRPVEGGDPATEWNGLLSIDETPGLLNPPNGWLYNSNNAPWSAAGPNSPKRSDFPTYVERGGENARGIHAIRLLDKKRDFTLESLVESAYDRSLPAFDTLIPVLLKAWDRIGTSNPLKAKLSGQVAALRAWDRRWSTDSVATTLAVLWGEEMSRRVARQAAQIGLSGRADQIAFQTDEYITKRSTPEELLEALAAVSDTLAGDFGTWKTPWGDINRYQRLTDDIVQSFNDEKPSIPVGFTGARWGSLASFGARTYTGTKKMYGTGGNSFVAVVEFGDRVRAKAVTAGGESGDPASRHFNDQAVRYSTGDLRDVYFYRQQLEGHIERQYKPGQ
jgi:acyl-homoserine-lactone acylase